MNLRTHLFLFSLGVAAFIGLMLLAGQLLPQVEQNALKATRHVIQDQINMYAADHSGRYPTVQNNRLPQLTHATNVHGKIGTPGPDYPYGPYLEKQLPANPCDGANQVVRVAVPGKKPQGVARVQGGWQYDETTGAIYPNHPQY